MKNKILLLFVLILLAACSTTVTKHSVTTTGGKASVDVNGHERCAETPCTVRSACTVGPLALNQESVFVVAYPLETSDTKYPQSAIVDPCDPTQHGVDSINFDLSQKTNPADFAPKKQLERSRLHFVSLGLQGFDYSSEPEYKMTSFGINYAWLFYTNNSVKLFTIVGAHTLSGKYVKEKDNFDPKAYSIENLYQIHFRGVEDLFLKAGPMFMLQSHGNAREVYGVYAGGGIFVSSLLYWYRHIPELEVGHSRLDITMEYGGLLAAKNFGIFSTNFVVFW